MVQTKKLVSKVRVVSFLAIVMLLIASVILPCTQAQADTATSKCWGVFVGVSSYQIGATLKYADANAQDFYNVLSPVWGTSQTRLLTNSQATKSAIMSALMWSAINAQSSDTVIFYFSGYFNSDNIIPYDANSYADSSSSYISSSELASAFQSVRAGKIVFIMEIPYSTNFQSALSGNGRVVLTGAASGETIWYDSTLQHHVFTYYILQAFKNFDTVDTNHDYQLSAEEIYRYAGPLTTQHETSYVGSSASHPVLDDGVSGDVPLLSKFTFTSNTGFPAGTSILTLDGTNYQNAPAAQLWAPGSAHTISVPQNVNIDSGSRYVFTGWNDGNTNATRTISGGALAPNYRKEYLLTISSAFGSPAGSGWYADGAAAAFSVNANVETANTKHHFNNWSGDFSGSSATGTLTMNAAKTVTANWRTEYLLSITSAYDTPTGAGWYNDGMPVGISVTAYLETSDTKHYFTGWSGDYTGTTASASLVMSAPKNVTANWRNEYLLKINSEYGQPTGAGWYKEGETVNISIDPEQGFLVRHIFTGWSGDLTDTQTNASLTMNAPKTITATWKADYIQLYITIGVVVVLIVIITITVVVVRGKSAKS